MRRETELDLIDQVLGQLASGKPHMAEHGGSAPVAHYLDHARHDAEAATVFSRFPIGLAHGAEIPQTGDFIVRDVLGKSIIVIRGSDGQARAFLNACRHRGSQLLSEPKGNARALVCPYHAWTYRHDGSLFGRPGAEGFCDLSPANLSLLAFECSERNGVVWVIPTPQVHAAEALDWDNWFLPLDEELAALNLPSHAVFSMREVEVAANWKVVNDAFMEGYHFRFVHRDSVYPLYCDNQGVFSAQGPHYRYFLAHRSMQAQAQLPRSQRQLRPNCLMVYQAFPVTSIQVLPDHIYLHTLLPLSAGRCILRNTMLIPEPPSSDKARLHWQRNREMVEHALDEDIAAAELVFKGISSGLNPDLVFGRFEQGIVHMHEQINAALGGMQAATRPWPASASAAGATPAPAQTQAA